MATFMNKALTYLGLNQKNQYLSKPEVPPKAEAENASSDISMVQAPLPTGMPDSVASYWASSRPWAEAACGVASSKNAPAQRPLHFRSASLVRSASVGEIMLCVVTTGRPSISQIENVTQLENVI